MMHNIVFATVVIVSRRVSLVKGRGEKPPARRAARLAGGGPLPVKGDSFQIKRISLDNPEEKFWGRFDSAPRPLLRPKERPAGLSFGNLLGVDGGMGVTGDVGTGDGGLGRGAWGDSGDFALWGTRLGEGLVVLAGESGGWGPRGGRKTKDEGSARRGRRALRVVAESFINHPG